MATWTLLLTAHAKYLRCAIIIVATLPLVASFLGLFGIERPNLVIPVTGALLYLGVGALTKLCCPKLIRDHPCLEMYRKWCLSIKDSPEIHNEFSCASNWDSDKLKKHLGDKTYLTPFHVGLRTARTETIREFSSFKYKITNTSALLMRWLFLSLLILSIVMMYFFTIQRIIHFYWRMTT